MFHVKHSPPHILLINPWITDFAAYNLWIKPLGLLYITSLLRENGFQVTLIDCLGFRIKKKKYLDGKFYKVKMEKPQPLKSIPRHYSRYGITEEMLLKRFSKMEKPDVIGITSGMTYWYPGLFKTIEMTKNVFNDVPIILGGIYATLCYEHALRHSGADYIVRGRGELKALELVSGLTHSKIRSSPKLDDPDYFPYPCFNLYPQLD